MHKDEEAGVNITKEVNEAINEPAKAILSIHDNIRDLQKDLEKIYDVMMDFVDEHNKNYNELKNQEKELKLIETVITRQDKAISRLEQKINKMQSWADDSEDLKPVDGAPASDNNEEILNLRLAIKKLQGRVFKSVAKLDDRLHEVEQGNFVGIPTKESSVGRLSGYDGSGDKELNIPVKLDDKGVDFFAGLKDIAKAADKDKESDKSDEEEKVLPDSDEDDSAMGRPFCKVVKGKVLKQDLYKGVGINEYKFPKSATYRIDYMHFFRNMYKWGAFDGFEVQLLSSNQPIVRERALLCLGNIDFAIVTIESRDRNQEGFYSIMVDNIRLIPSFFKLGKIFGAKTYPEFMDAIEVTR